MPLIVFTSSSAIVKICALFVVFPVGLEDAFQARTMAGKLKPLDIARLVTPGKYADGDGLYLVVAGPSSRNWSYRYWIRGKERWHGLGSLNDSFLERGPA
jgi:hypothetical protein